MPRKTDGFPILTALLLCLLILSGCATPDGNELLSRIQEIQQAATEKAAPGTLLVEISKIELPDERGRGMFFFMRGGNVEVNFVSGLAISAEGDIVLPMYIKRSEGKRLLVRVGEEEYKARIIKGISWLGLTFIRIKPKQPLQPVVFGDGNDVETGDWLISLTRARKEEGSRLFADLVRVRGKQETTSSDGFIVEGARSYGRSSNFYIDLSGRVVARGRGGSAEFINRIRDAADRYLGEDKAAEVDKESALKEEEKKVWLGIQWDAVNRNYAEAAGLPREAILVRAVTADSPASRAGLKPFDLIVGINGNPIRKKGNAAIGELRRALIPEEGRTIALTIRRGDETVDTEVAFEEWKDPRELKVESLGISITEIVERFHAGLFKKQGVLITEVIAGSSAATGEGFGETLISGGDVIVEMDGEAVRGMDDFIRILQEIESRDAKVVLVKLYRGNVTRLIALNLKIGQKSRDKKKGAD